MAGGGDREIQRGSEWIVHSEVGTSEIGVAGVCGSKAISGIRGDGGTWSGEHCTAEALGGDELGGWSVEIPVVDEWHDGGGGGELGRRGPVAPVPGGVLVADANAVGFPGDGDAKWDGEAAGRGGEIPRAGEGLDLILAGLGGEVAGDAGGGNFCDAPLPCGEGGRALRVGKAGGREGEASGGVGRISGSSDGGLGRKICIRWGGGLGLGVTEAAVERLPLEVFVAVAFLAIEVGVPILTYTGSAEPWNSGGGIGVGGKVYEPLHPVREI